MNLYCILHYYRCIATALSCHFRNIKVESKNGSYLESLDALGLGKRVLNRVCTDSLTANRWQNIHVIPYFLKISTNISSNLCNNSDQTWISNTLTFARSRERCWKPRPPGPEGDVENRGQRQPGKPRDLTNVHAWKTLFDPYIKADISGYLHAYPYNN